MCAVYLVLDQGTSSTKVFLFNEQQEIRFSSRLPHHLSYPAPDHVESDPLAILEVCFRLIKEALDFARQSGQNVASAGLSVQRSTFLFWDKTTARPLTPAISWQDTRAGQETVELADSAQFIQERTGTPLSAHFGGPKFMHLTRRNPELAQKISNGNVLFGPLSAFLSQSLTGEPGVDHSIAGRSLCLNLDTLQWDPELCRLFGISENDLPPLKPTTGDFGQITINRDTLPLRCVIGDQQAALLGQGGQSSGDLVLNYGTSGSVLLNSGDRPGHIPGLISSVLHSSERERRFMIEGTINTCKSLFDWLEQDLRIPVHRRKWDLTCRETTTAGVLIPGYSGIAAPYWRDRFETVLAGIDVTNHDQVLRAAVESIGFFTYDIIALIRRHLSLTLRNVTASGGISRASLLQFVADLLEVPIGHTRLKDHTALGVCQLLFSDAGIKINNRRFDRLFLPRMHPDERQRKIEAWHSALRRAGIEPVI
ncbi:MAG: FGGY family carbohydrate kinase [Candidatus Neomarinimicrobiota bacterium]